MTPRQFRIEELRRVREILELQEQLDDLRRQYLVDQRAFIKGDLVSLHFENETVQSAWVRKVQLEGSKILYELGPVNEKGVKIEAPLKTKFNYEIYKHGKLNSNPTYCPQFQSLLG